MKKVIIEFLFVVIEMFLSVLSDLVTTCSYKFKGVFKKLHVTIRTYFTRIGRDFFGDMGEGLLQKHEKGKSFCIGGAVFRWLEIFIGRKKQNHFCQTCKSNCLSYMKLF